METPPAHLLRCDSCRCSVAQAEGRIDPWIVRAFRDVHADPTVHEVVEVTDQPSLFEEAI